MWYNSSIASIDAVFTIKEIVTMGGYNIPQQVRGMSIVYLCPDCYGLVMFPMIPPSGVGKPAPLARCSKCHKLCEHIVGINLGALHEQTDGFQIHTDSEGRGLESSVEPHQGKAEQNV